MFLLNTFSTATILILTWLRLTLALPTDNAALLSRQTVPADTIDKYTVAYFQQAATNKPPSNTCLFYTAGLTKAARSYADENTLYTIWGVWPCSFYNRDQEDTNPLREILKKNPDGSNTADGQTYFEHMSEAYASLCSGDTWVMVDTLPQVNEAGIWGRIEKPTLQKTGNPGGQVNRIDACDENLSNCIVPPYWTRASNNRLVRDVSSHGNITEPEKRQTSGCALCASLPNTCYTPDEQASVFSDIDKLW